MASDGTKRMTLAELEALLEAARQDGTKLPDWFDQLAGELRAAAPENASAPPCPALADRILAEPRLSLGAQANVDPRKLGVLKR